MYVVGEVLVSLLVLSGGFALVYYSADQAVQLVGSGAISAATVFWFQRRSTEQSNNSVRSVTEASLYELHEQQRAQRDSISAMLQVLSSRGGEGAR